MFDTRTGRQRPHIGSVINPRIVNDISRNIHTVHTGQFALFDTRTGEHAKGMETNMSGEGISDTLKYRLTSRCW